MSRETTLSFSDNQELKNNAQFKPNRMYKYWLWSKKKLAIIQLLGSSEVKSPDGYMRLQAKLEII